jgi:hypothetical protein
VAADPGQLGQADAGRGEHRDDRGVAARGERPALAGLGQFHIAEEGSAELAALLAAFFA